MLLRTIFLTMLLLVAACETTTTSSLQNTAPLDDQGFASHVRALIAAQLPGTTVNIKDPLTLETFGPDGKRIGEINLDRIREFCRANAARCSPALEQFRLGIVESTRAVSQPVEKGMLRLIVRSHAYLMQAVQQLGAEGPRVLSRPFADDLVAIPVIDFARSVRYVTARDLDTLKLTEDEVFRTAESNVRAALRPLSQVAPKPKADSFAYIENEDYASSRLLFHADWADLNSSLNGQLIVMIPSPDVVLYGDGSTAVGVEALRTFGQEVARRSERALSPLVLRWTASGWEPVQ